MTMKCPYPCGPCQGLFLFIDYFIVLLPLLFPSTLLWLLLSLLLQISLPLHPLLLLQLVLYAQLLLPLFSFVSLLPLLSSFSPLLLILYVYDFLPFFFVYLLPWLPLLLSSFPLVCLSTRFPLLPSILGFSGFLFIFYPCVEIFSLF
jgi:hypothetical protein